MMRNSTPNLETAQHLPEAERMDDMIGNAIHSAPFPILIMKRVVAARSPDTQKEGARDSDKEQALLEELFSVWTFVDRPPFFHSDLSEPGLVSALVGDKTVYVPIHLAPLFPTEKNLEELVNRAEEVRAMTDTTICLSGSKVFGINSAVDTDYCEYVLHTGQRLASSFVRLDVNRRSICVTVQHGGKKLAGSQVLTEVMSLCQTDSGRIGDSCKCERREWKFDYFCKMPNAQNIVVTNLCVHENDCEKSSWAYQEAAIKTFGQPLREVVDPTQLSRYVDWLRQQIEEYMKSNEHLKGLKRALSLCRILRLKQFDSILEILNSPFAVQFAEKKAAIKVAELKKYLEPQTQKRISVLASKSGYNVSDECKFCSEANSILVRVIEQYNNLFQSAERLVNAKRTRS